MAITCNYLIVGSGATGAIAAKTLVDKNQEVTLIDVGIENPYLDSVGSRNFTDIRKNDPNQKEIFLGRHFEGIGWENTKVGAQLTPPRMYLIKSVQDLTPFNADTLEPMESLAKGGLGGGWGAGCFVFSHQELEKTGLSSDKMGAAYNAVAEHIGISGCQDDGSEYALAGLRNIQAPQRLEHKMQYLYDKYAQQKKQFNSKGLYLGKLPLALLTENKGDRKATAYNNMDFYGDDDRSAYRSWMTIQELQSNNRLHYKQNLLAVSFKEVQDSTVEVTAIDTLTKETIHLTCKKLILAAGVLGTSRIVARSIPLPTKRLPFICNPYAYTACVQPRFLGSQPDPKRSSFGQLALYVDPNKNHSEVSLAVLFSYSSLLLNKLMKEIPLNFSDSRALVQFLHTGLTIAGIHFPDQPSNKKYIELVQDNNTITGDHLTGHYALNENEILTNRKLLQNIHKGLRKLGCYPVKTVHLPAGASIHYAGTLPFNNQDKPLGTTQTNGLLNGTKNVFIADGCGFRYLPAKGLTLTLMANAHHVALSTL